MLQIVESVCSGPIRFLPDLSSGHKFKTGLVVQLVETSDGTPKCCISDGSRPFGIIGENLEMQPFGLIPVWFETMILRTDVFEKKGATYEMGDALYINKRGMISSIRPFENSFQVGYVIAGPGDGRRYIELNWT